MDAAGPLERANELAERGVSPEQWTEAELEAYCAQFPEFDVLSYAELEILADDPESEAGRAVQAKLAEERARR